MSFLSNFIRSNPMVATFLLALCWGTWSVTCRKSGLSRDWINFVTIILPAIIFIFATFTSGKVHFEKPPTFSAWFWISITAITYTLSVFLMRGFINSQELNVSGYIPIAQTFVPLLVMFFSYLILGEELTVRKLVGVCVAGIGIYLIIKK